MVTIFKQENEPLTECAKVDDQLTKVQNSGMAAAVTQLRYQLNTMTGVTFTVAANHLISEVSQTHAYQLSRQINATNTNMSGSGCGYGRGRGAAGCGRGGGSERGGCGAKGESQKTTYYSKEEWEKLSNEERDRIRKEHDQKGEQEGGTKRSIAEMSTKQLTTALISSLKAEATEEGKSGSESETGAPMKPDPAMLLAAGKTRNDSKPTDSW